MAKRHIQTVESADAVPVHEETVRRIGKPLEGDAERDAIHVAVFPAVAGTTLHAGMSVKLESGVAIPTRDEPRIGIVDPFLRQPIYEGERCYIFMNPGSITSLRHEWTHPLVTTVPIQPKDNKKEAERYLREFADKWRLNYSELISTASSIEGDGWNAYVTADGVDLHSPEDLGEDHDLFWHNLEILTEKKFDTEYRAKMGWSCSC